MADKTNFGYLQKVIDVLLEILNIHYEYISLFLNTMVSLIKNNTFKTHNIYLYNEILLHCCFKLKEKVLTDFTLVHSTIFEPCINIFNGLPSKSFINSLRNRAIFEFILKSPDSLLNIIHSIYLIPYLFADFIYRLINFIEATVNILANNANIFNEIQEVFFTIVLLNRIVNPNLKQLIL